MGTLGESPLVLIVDDDEGTRHTLTEVLHTAGWMTVTAASGEVALETARDRRPAIAVLDHHLPDVRGTELVARLKEIDGHMPVLLVTGYASLDSAMHAVGQFDEYLVKPVPPERLIQ
ncbi:MAG TPA: response regulator, partial [Mycobacteriales bacterium]|nr:response regulator [Mycobacteriales bacterium]